MGEVIGFTGHRPSRLGGYGSVVRDRLIYLAISYLARTEPERVITGMALGWDLAVAEAAVYLDIPFIAAVPYPLQDSRWPQDEQLRYRHLLNKAAWLHVQSQTFGYEHLFARNRWIVDKSTRLAALWDGEKTGGTWDCIRYATDKLPIDQLWEDWNGNGTSHRCWEMRDGNR